MFLLLFHKRFKNYIFNIFELNYSKIFEYTKASDESCLMMLQLAEFIHDV